MRVSPRNYQPPINKLRAGKKGEIVIEVLMHLNPEMVRGISLTPTLGLSRDSFVTDTEQPICVPVGRQILVRAFNVFGETIDNGDALKDVD